MINIDLLKQNGEIIGRGAERTCYQLPDKPDRVFKVCTLDKSKQSRREIKYFAFLEKRGVPFDHIPKYYGYTADNNHLIIEQEKVVGDDGSPAISFADYVKEGCTDEEIRFRYEECLKLLDQVEIYLSNHNIVTCDINPYNILRVRREGKPTFVIIDGLGTEDFIPLSQYFSFLGKPKIKRHTEKVRRKLKKFYQMTLNKDLSF